MPRNLPIEAHGSVTGAFPAPTVDVRNPGVSGVATVAQLIISSGGAGVTISINGTAAFVVPANSVISVPPILPPGSGGNSLNAVDPTTYSSSAAVTLSYVIYQ